MTPPKKEGSDLLKKKGSLKIENEINKIRELKQWDKKD